MLGGIAAVLVFGLGVVVLNRRRSPELTKDRTSEIVRPPRPAVDPRPARDTSSATGTAVLEPPATVEPEIEAESLPEAEPEVTS